MSGAADHHDHRNDGDYFSHSGALFCLMSAEQKALLIGSIVGAMKPVTRDVQLRQLGYFLAADRAYGSGIAAGIGIDPCEIA